MKLLLKVNKIMGSGSSISLFLSLLFFSAPRLGLQPAVLACLAESTSSLLKAVNLKRQHVVGTTLGGSHTQHTHIQSSHYMKPCFFKELQKASERSNNCSGCSEPTKKWTHTTTQYLPNLLFCLYWTLTQTHFLPSTCDTVTRTLFFYVLQS